MEIDTSFGFVVINGKKYNYDVIVYWNGKVIKRNKEKSSKLKEKYHHTPFSKEEVEDLFKYEVEKVYIGTGQYGALPVLKEAIEEIKKKGVKLIIMNTKEVIREIVKDKSKWVALLHVTC